MFILLVLVVRVRWSLLDGHANAMRMLAANRDRPQVRVAAGATGRPGGRIVFVAGLWGLRLLAGC